jgi:hypothetical protein
MVIVVIQIYIFQMISIQESYLEDHFSENVEVSKSKSQQVVLSYLTL